MRVLQVLMPQGMGGVERIAVSIHKFLKQRGCNSYILVSDSRLNEFRKHFGITTDDIKPLNDSNLIATILDLKQKISVLKPDIIHVHARKETVFSALCCRCTPIIRTQHMSETPRIKVTSVEKKLLAKKVKIWVSVSEKLKNVYLDNLDYVDPCKVYVIYNGVKEATEKNCGREVKFCIASRLTRQKGIDILLNNINSYPQNLKDRIKIDIYGEGEELNNINWLIDEYGLTNIKYKGTTNHPSEIMCEYYALLMPSRYEGLPLTMLEAMSAMTPVAIHDVGCVREFLINKKNGWIIDEVYPWRDFFEDALLYNYNHDSIKKECYNCYRKNFSENVMCENYVQLYEQLNN